MQRVLKLVRRPRPALIVATAVALVLGGLAWVNLSERDSFMGRMLAHFSLFVMPGQQ